MRCKDCHFFKKCDETLFKAAGVHLKDEEHNCLEYAPKENNKKKG